ncbi:MAG: ABC transporter permease [Blastocatellia bacterium]|nr:ABC transporter permease [Blastocatellia bacterium]
MKTLWQDIRFSFRMMRKTPGMTALAVLSIALGIGANTTIYTWIKALLLRPLPGVTAPHEMIDLCGTIRNTEGLSISFPDYQDIRDGNQTLAGVMVYRMISSLAVGQGAQTDRITGNLVSGNYFEVLGVRPAVGRAFRPEEDQKPNAVPVVVISYGFWQTRMGANPNVIGQTIHLNRHPFTVVGVAPRDFSGTYTGLVCDVWVPIMMQEAVFPLDGALTGRTSRWLNMMGRLKPGVSLAQAQANLNVLSVQLAQKRSSDDSFQITAYYPSESPNGIEKRLSPVLLTLLGVVGLVLLISCANVANLLLSRASSRRREIGIRLALGAGRWRVLRQLLTESLVLAWLGGGLGLLLAFWAADTLMWFIPPVNYTVRFELGLDRQVLVFSLLLTCMTGILFGLAPALQATKTDLATTLKDEAGSLSMTGKKASLRNLLVIGQVALTIVTLVCAGLFLRSLHKSQTANPGFQVSNQVFATFDLFSNGYDEARGQVFCQRVLEDIRTRPGVEHACLTRRLPLSLGGNSSSFIQIEGYNPPPGENMITIYEVVSPGYFATLGIPIEQGRDFSDSDTDSTPPVVIINRTMAARYWPQGNALGKRIFLGKTPVEVIGVATDIKYKALNEAHQPFMFLPAAQNYRSTYSLVLKTRLDSATALELAQQSLKAVDPNLTIFEKRTFRESIQGALFPSRIAASLLGVMGVLALTLSLIGLYGVISYSVSQRTREIGIRLALGADAQDILKLVVGEGVRLILMGSLVGTGLALGAGRLLGKLLYGVSPADPLTFAAVLVVLAGTGVTACVIPFLRALQIDPMQALRYE